MAGWFIQHLLLLLRTAFAPVPGAAIISRDRHSRQAIPGKLDSRPRSIMSRQWLPALISIR